MDNLPLKDIENSPVLIVAVLVGAAIIMLWPLAVIWSFNTLFGTVIPMEFKTWLAVIVLTALLRMPAAYPEKR